MTIPLAAAVPFFVEDAPASDVVSATANIGAASSSLPNYLRWQLSGSDPVVTGASSVFKSVTGPVYVQWIEFNLLNNTTSYVRFRFSTSTGSTSGAEAGPELIDAVENNDTAFKFTFGAHSFIVPGPNSSQWTDQDATEPYQMQPTGDLLTSLRAAEAAYRGASAQDRTGTVLTISSGAQS